MRCDIARLFEVDIIAKLHVLGVNSEDLKTPCRVGNTDIDFSIEAAETAECRIDRIRSVRGGHDNNIGPRFEAVHES